MRLRFYAPVVAITVLAVVSGFVIATVVPLAAHHAIQAQYDLEKTEAFRGKLTRFAMINPHCRWFFEETKTDGAVVTWEMSGAGPGALRSAGLVRIFEVGDVYDVTFAPARDGANLGRVRTMTLPDGRVVTLYHEDPTNPLNR